MNIFDEFGYLEVPENFNWDCDICKRIKNLGFTESQTKMLIYGIEEAYYCGGDGGGPYGKFKYAIEKSLDKMEEIKKELEL